MTRKETEALIVANKYTNQHNLVSKVKWLGTELVELAIGIANNDKENVQEEIGDMAFILLHISSYYGDKGLEALLHEAVKKVIVRNNPL